MRQANEILKAASVAARACSLGVIPSSLARLESRPDITGAPSLTVIALTSLRGRRMRARDALGKHASVYPGLFAHWKLVKP